MNQTAIIAFRCGRGNPIYKKEKIAIMKGEVITMKKVYVSLADFRVTKWVLFLVEIFEDL